MPHNCWYVFLCASRYPAVRTERDWPTLWCTADSVLNLSGHGLETADAVALAACIADVWPARVRLILVNQLPNIYCQSDLCLHVLVFLLISQSWWSEVRSLFDKATPKACATSSFIFSWNRLGDEGAYALICALAPYSSLTDLDLRGNHLQADGAVAVACKFIRHPTLTQLRLSFGEHIAQTQSKCSTSDAVAALSALIRTNSTLTCMDWSGPCDASDTFQVALALRINSGLRQFRLQLGDTILDTVHSLPRGDRLAFRRALGYASPASTEADSVSDARFLIDAEDLSLEHELGRGHFGAVFASEWCGRGRVCVKVFFAGDPHAMQLQINEFALINELGPARTVALEPYCVFAERFVVTAANELQIVLPWMNLGPLASMEYDPKITGPDRVERLAQAARALAMTHAHGVVHRDVASRNFLMQIVDGAVKVKLCDFGLACDVSKPWQPEIAPLWIWPPEVMVLHQPFSSAGDVFSFGLLLVDALNQGLVRGLLDHDVVASLVLPPTDMDAVIRTAESDIAVSATTLDVSAASAEDVKQTDNSSPLPMHSVLQSVQYMPFSRAPSQVASASAVFTSGFTRSCFAEQTSNLQTDPLRSWALRRSLLYPNAISPALPLLIEWCTHPIPTARPSMRLMACVLQLLHHRDLSGLPDLFMSPELAVAPDFPADWRLVSRVWVRAAGSMTTVSWAGRPVSELAVQAVVELLPARHHHHT